MQHAVYLPINQMLCSFGVYMTEQGLQGNLQELLDNAGMGGILCNFPENPDGLLYGFMVRLARAPGRPAFWVILHDLEAPEAYMLRPMSWSNQWAHISFFTQAQYAQMMFRRIIEDKIPNWKGFTLTSRVAALLDEVDQNFWRSFIAEKEPIFDWQGLLPSESDTQAQADMSGLIMNFYDGSQIVLNEKYDWPSEISTGLLRMEKTSADPNEETQVIHYNAAENSRLQ